MSASSPHTRYNIATIIIDVIGVLLGVAWLGMIAFFFTTQFKDMAIVLSLLTLFVVVIALWNDFGFFE